LNGLVVKGEKYDLYGIRKRGIYESISAAQP